METKLSLEKEKKTLEESATEKEALLARKLGQVGNYVHESVPISNNEVRTCHWECLLKLT
jgi:seryl-tRNA synthetase